MCVVAEESCDRSRQLGTVQPALVKRKQPAADHAPLASGRAQRRCCRVADGRLHSSGASDSSVETHTATSQPAKRGGGTPACISADVGAGQASAADALAHTDAAGSSRQQAVMAGTEVVQAADMRDSTDLFERSNWRQLRDRLQQDGYLMLRGVLDATSIAEARAFLLKELHAARPECFAPGVCCSQARAAEGAKALGLLSRQDLAAAPQVAAVLESPQLFQLMAGLLQEEVITTGFKWLRAVACSEFTGLHTDRVFLGRGSARLLTAWLPLGEVPPRQGSLLVAAGSHRLPAFAAVRADYGVSQVGADGTRSGWLSDSGASLAAHIAGPVDWRVADCHPGDVVILGLDTLHMSASNECSPSRIRLSCDTRWQPAADARDPRLAVWRSAAECGVS